MTEKLALVYDEIYQDWLLGRGDGSHPTNPVRAKLAVEMLQASMGDNVVLVKPNPEDTREADLALLNQTHDPAYVAKVLAGESAEWDGMRPSMGEAGFAMFRGTVRAVELLLSGEAKVVFNPQGAKHHAQYRRATGFCVFNDMAYAAKALQATGLRPLYIDWDIHAGDGVFHMLKGTGIPTISIHHGATYPVDSEMQLLTGQRGELHDADAHNYNFNVAQGDGDDVFMQYIDAAGEIIDSYQPDVILLAAGADGHTGQSNLGNLANYTSVGFTYAAQMIAQKANAYTGGRVLIGGAGGYQPLKETPETWALVVENIYNQTRKA